MSELVKVAVDAMGGDYAPQEIVKGAVDAVNANEKVRVTLFGTKDAVDAELAKYAYPADRLDVYGTTEVIEMAEPPVNAIRTKKDSSMVVAMKMVKDGTYDAFVTAGSSGAALVGGTLLVGRIRGIERAPFAPLLPTSKGPVLLLDCGANVDARPSQLVQWAQKGSIYMESVVGIRNPRVALFNIGTEEEKGNALTKETYPLLKALDTIHFTGNIEAREIPNGGADVVVCDAFAGNAILKMYEGTASMLMGEIKDVLMTNAATKLGALLIRSQLRKTMKKFSTSTYGGAPLLGLNGLVMKTHGNAKAIAVQHSIEQCITFREQNINQLFREKMQLADRAKKD